MSAGRCAGRDCGYENKSCKVVKEHILTCPSWLKLYQEHPEQALDPEEEYRRWRDEDQAGVRAEHKTTVQAANADRRTAMAARFATPPELLS